MQHWAALFSLCVVLFCSREMGQAVYAKVDNDDGPRVPLPFAPAVNARANVPVSRKHLIAVIGKTIQTHLKAMQKT